MTLLPMNPQEELRRLFQGAVEQALISEMGICAPALTDYLGELLSDFVRMDQIYRIQSVTGQTIRELSCLRAQAELGSTADERARARTINRYIGDFALFWTGVYPENLSPRRHLGVDLMREYVLYGKRGYEVASELSAVDDIPSARLLCDLSQEFESCVRALRLVRATWDELLRRPRRN
jgi:hypothetical protein